MPNERPQGAGRTADGIALGVARAGNQLSFCSWPKAHEGWRGNIPLLAVRGTTRTGGGTALLA
ncbi:hypothetical protein [Nocardia sp. XZ_19_369]|uniref:hypothetical protein n=1 Tax=Nocardia sp. XZ_19_369 TaxID=2769487 RepID=UPI0018900320|nr:hypothetical protein [Nocardia sp. XZ_19_369]